MTHWYVSTSSWVFHQPMSQNYSILVPLPYNPCSRRYHDTSAHVWSHIPSWFDTHNSTIFYRVIYLWMTYCARSIWGYNTWMPALLHSPLRFHSKWGSVSQLRWGQRLGTFRLNAYFTDFGYTSFTGMRSEGFWVLQRRMTTSKLRIIKILDTRKVK